ncbi:MAG: type VI secretion system baseplate subunit TssG [Chitinophagales bacterium]
MDFEEILNHFDAIEGDIKAESIFAVLERNGFNSEHFITRNKSTFHRPNGKDIAHVYFDESSKIEDFLSVELNRNGLYDYLPEGLFHQQTDSISRQTKVDEWVKQARHNKVIEDDSRKFFLPVEHEVFLSRLRLEDKEVSILESMQKQDVGNLLFAFWGLKYSRNVKGLNLLVYLLPMLEKIIGNLQLTEACYEIILGEKVRIQKSYLPKNAIQVAEPFTLNGSFLGQNTVIGNSTPSAFPTLTFTIGPLKRFSLSDYLQKGTLHQTLQLLHSYFVPVEADIEEEIIPNEDEKTFVLGEKNENCRLGFICIS